MAPSVDDLVMQMSTDLLALTPEGLALTMQDNLERISRAVGADRGYLLKTEVEGRSGGTVFQEWWAPGVEQRNTPIAELPLEAQRFWFRCLRSGEIVAAADVEELDGRCREAAEVLRGDGVRSILFIPLMAADQAVGFLGFEGRRTSTVWEPAVIARLRTVGELIVVAVERCDADLERSTAARLLAERNAELERSNRELQQFAAVVSHDLGQPLAVIDGFVELLRSIPAANEEDAASATRYIDAAQRAIVRMRGLIADVLEVARAGAPVAVTDDVDLDEVVQQVRDDLASAMRETDGAVTCDPLPVIKGNATQLRQLLQNLVSNALKFRRPDRPPVVHIGAREWGGSVELVVSDNGVGIPLEDRDSVFEMFVRGDHPEASGMGIGLAVCARVVANHRGRIRMEESDDGGCAVIVTLPLEQVVAGADG